MNLASYLLYLSGSRGKFHVYDQSTGFHLAKAPMPDGGAGTTCIHLPPLALSEGDHVLGVEYVDAYGSVSTRGTIGASIDALGSPSLPLRGLLAVDAKATKAGKVRLRWTAAFKDTEHIDPAEYQVARADDPDTIIHTEGFSGGESYTVDVGPFTDGSTVELMVRPKSGATVGAWLSAEPVVADAAGPAPPVIHV